MNVFTECLETADIVITDGIIAGIGNLRPGQRLTLLGRYSVLVFWRTYSHGEHLLKEGGLCWLTERWLSSQSDPFMTLAFVSLEVIPEVRLNTCGLMDVTKQHVLEVFRKMRNKAIKKKKEIVNKKTNSNVIQLLTTAYVLILLLIYPLYYRNKYYDMGEAKYFFFKWVSLIFFGIILLISTVGFFRKAVGKGEPIPWRKFLHSLSVLDWFVIAYGTAVWLSFLLSSYQKDAIWGYPGWYMGIVSQMIFILIYFYVSRNMKFREWMLHGICAVSTAVFLLAVLHRFQIDPLQMYDGLSMDNKIMFLSTMGQATWYSSYLCIVFPMGVYLYWNSTGLVRRIFYGGYIALGFASMVTQNSDSAFVAFSLILLVLFAASFRTNEKMMRFLEILIIGFTAICVIGVLQLYFTEAVVPLEQLSITASQGNLTRFLLLTTVVVYFAFCLLYSRNRIQILHFQKVGYGLAGFVVAVILGIVLCIYLNAKGILPSFLAPLQRLEYFNFNDDWGNGRGFTWRCAWEIFREYPLKNKLFGCGPDCFASYAYDRYAETLSSRWGNHVLTNAHNEWFTSLLFFGMTGLITYLGIFVTAVASFWKDTLKHPFLLVIIMSVAAYFGHNFFCYQQVICTPVIFILLGFGENVHRNGENVL
ncbi:MAG: O-antigen ligase family protein [Lachnospiraceae bacterium]|nr:O-antigen ligase family protein [Lachnospiraceae bacterium]